MERWALRWKVYFYDKDVAYWRYSLLLIIFLYDDSLFFVFVLSSSRCEAMRTWCAHQLWVLPSSFLQFLRIHCYHSASVPWNTHFKVQCIVLKKMERVQIPFKMTWHEHLCMCSHTSYHLPAPPALHLVAHISMSTNYMAKAMWCLMTLGRLRGPLFCSWTNEKTSTDTWITLYRSHGREEDCSLLSLGGKVGFRCL